MILESADPTATKEHKKRTKGRTRIAQFCTFASSVPFCGSTVCQWLALLLVCLWVGTCQARYLNPNTGRFQTMDSYEGSRSDPLSLHKYTYCQNNPVNGVDPSGNESLIGLSVASAIATGLQVSYDSTVTAAGFITMNTLSAVAFGMSVDELMPHIESNLSIGDEGVCYNFSVMGLGGEGLVTLKADIIWMAKSGIKMMSSVPKTETPGFWWTATRLSIWTKTQRWAEGYDRRRGLLFPLFQRPS